MVQHLHDRLLIFYYVLLLVFADESFEHHLHGVELPVPKTPDQIDLAEASDGQTLANFVSFESSLSHVLETVEGGFPAEDTLSYGNLVVEQDILVDGFEANHLSSFEERVGIAHIEQVAIDFLVKYIGPVSYTHLTLPTILLV